MWLTAVVEVPAALASQPLLVMRERVGVEVFGVPPDVLVPRFSRACAAVEALVPPCSIATSVAAHVPVAIVPRVVMVF